MPPGFAFLAKMLQAFLVVPGFAVTYLWAGPPRLGRRIWQTVLMGAGIVVSAGWWILAAELTPAADRPYFNGTDPWPTLAVFKELVARREIHYYVGQGSQSFGGGRGSSAIATWVAAHFTKQTVGGQTVYDLTKPLS